MTKKKAIEHARKQMLKHYAEMHASQIMRDLDHGYDKQVVMLLADGVDVDPHALSREVGAILAANALDFTLAVRQAPPHGWEMGVKIEPRTLPGLMRMAKITPRTKPKPTA
jgi:hypothetical protein